jgi:uncharacterized iron-regulated protein
LEVLANDGTVLFGEVHDNPGLHRERSRIIRDVVMAGARPAFAFEQFDRESQPAIDRMMSTELASATQLIEAVAPARAAWQWSFYRPLLEIALKYRLPIVAVNLSRSDAMKIAETGLQQSPVFTPEMRKQFALDRTISADIYNAQVLAIRRGHCNLLPESALSKMVDAQLARDAVMADRLKSMRGAQIRGVILFAGNGHVQRDIGVPIWLDRRAPVLVIGMLEKSDVRQVDLDEAAKYDVTITGDAAQRDDPCAALAKQLGTTPVKK